MRRVEFMAADLGRAIQLTSFTGVLHLTPVDLTPVGVISRPYLNSAMTDPYGKLARTSMIFTVTHVPQLGATHVL